VDEAVAHMKKTQPAAKLHFLELDLMDLAAVVEAVKKFLTYTS
jgi:hypothetical protein